MSEEKPTFKITDRRLFNADGSARDLPPEEDRATVETSVEDVAASPASEPGTETSRLETGTRQFREDSTQTTGAGAAPSPAREDAATGQTESEDPQAFLMLVEFIASFAADALGMVDHPGEGRAEVNLPLARQCIDMLVTLKRKTRNNLSPEEQQVLDVILSQLRMQFVKVANAARGQQPAGGFTGGDITGGR